MNIVKKFLGPVDMTEGTPWKKIATFAVPMLLGNIAQQLYNTVDSIIVGKYMGDNALAAVGSAGPIVNLLIVPMLELVWGQAYSTFSTLEQKSGRIIKNYRKLWY